LSQNLLLHTLINLHRIANQLQNHDAHQIPEIKRLFKGRHQTQSNMFDSEEIIVHKYATQSFCINTGKSIQHRSSSRSKEKTNTVLFTQ
jgi:hypothetical protein